MEHNATWRSFLAGKRWERIRVTLLSTVLFGLVSQGIGMFNQLSCGDDIVTLSGAATSVSSDRWMLHILERLETVFFMDGQFSLPLFHGLFSILCIAAAACLLVDLLRIRRQILCAGLGCFMVSFPVVTAWFGYMSIMPCYALSMLMMVAGACLICRKNVWWMKLTGILLCGCSVGIFQASVSLLVSVLLLYDLACLSEREEKLSIMIKRLTVQAVCITGAIAFCLVMNRFFLEKSHMEMTAYMGLDQLKSTPILTYLKRAGRAYREFFLPARNVSTDMYPMHSYYLYLAMLCSNLAMGIGQIKKLGKNNPDRALLLALFLGLTPLGSNFIYVVSDQVNGLMTYGQIAPAVLFVWLADRTVFHNKAFQKIASGLTAGILGLSCVMYARYDNQCYLKITFQQEQAISYYTTLTARIKSVEGYWDDIPVAFLNGEKIEDDTIYNINELDFIQLQPYGETLQSYLNAHADGAFLARWCGFAPHYVDAAAYEGLPEIQDMPRYPDDGSIRNLGDVIVVNF